MGWLAAWAGSLAVLGLPLPSLPADQLASLAARRKAELRPVDRDQLGRAFAACGHQGGMALLDALDAAGQH